MQVGNLKKVEVDEAPGRSYLDRLYGGFNGRGYVAVTTLPDRQVLWFRTDQLDELYAKQIELAQTRQTYHSWTVMAEPLGRFKRGGTRDVLGSPGLFIDLDIKSEHHSETRLPSSYEEIREWFDELEIPEPSQIRSSGNGIYADWLHPEPVFFETLEARQDYQRSVRAFHAMLKIKAREMRGWHFDPTQDLTRITRMPETLNHKNTPPKSVELV